MRRQPLGRLTRLLFALALAGSTSSARAQSGWEVTRCEAVVDRHEVQFHADLSCSADCDDARLDVYPHLAGMPPEQNGSGTYSIEPLTVASPSHTFPHSLLWATYPNGKYRLFCQVNSTLNGQQVALSGPNEWVVGPDLWILSFSVSKDRATTKYTAVVCNTGTDVARHFRVGFYYNRSTPPPDGEYSDAFKSVEELGYHLYHWWWPVCKEVKYERHDTPNGVYDSWVKADSGSFVDESDEGNNVYGPYHFVMANPDLVIEAFDAEVSDSKPYVVTYHVKVCNRGAAIARVFWIDIYFDREIDDPPQLGQPGEIHQRVDNLGVNGCVEDWFDAAFTERAEPYGSWAQADSDEFVVDPDRSNNLKGPVYVQVPGGALPPGCTDADGDGVGVGQDCTGPQDCDDENASIYPGAPEDCEDTVDNDCDGNINECCHGVDCCDDNDNDGAPVGSDCQQPDCDDNDPQRSPLNSELCDDTIDNDCDGIVNDCCENVDCCDMDNDGYGIGEGCAALGVEPDCNDADPRAGLVSDEVCGDTIDNDCDGITDDCCPGVFCCDQDNDGYGVGVGCPGPQDPDDGDPTVHPGAEEVCGNGIDDDGNGIPDDGCDTCVDLDGDGFCVGDGDCSADHPECVNRPRDCMDVPGSSGLDPAQVNPDAVEICNGFDDNCNGTIDDTSQGGETCKDPNCIMACAELDCITSTCPNAEPMCLYACGQQNASCAENCEDVDCADGDGDGWGTGPDCTWPDCDDADPDIHPGAEEVCDGVTDENCNGTIDDGTLEHTCPQPDCVIACATGQSCEAGCAGDPACLYQCGASNTGCVDLCAPVDCIDGDGDGWPVGSDCAIQDPDDTDPSVHPGAPEICGDGLDQNGDGVADNGCLLCIDLDRDGYGVGSHCVEPDCNDLDPSTHPNAHERCGGPDKNCDGITVPSAVCPNKGCAAARCRPAPAPPLSALLLIALLAGLVFARRRPRR